ncbi:MAG: hypothetical protein ABI128_03735 [Rhodanobacter sp.]
MTAVLATVLLVMGAAGASTSTTIGSGALQNAAIRAAEVWAFPMEQTLDPSTPKPSQAPKPDPHKTVHVPGSVRTYTLAYIDTLFNATDWFPQDHPVPPRIVLHGRTPAWACGACHFPNGEGDVTSAALAGLSKAYILEQIAAFRAGERGKGQPLSATMMAEEARNLSDTESQQAADYFSSLKRQMATRVVETSRIPRTHWDGFVLVPNRNGAHESVGERIIEVSNDQALNDFGDERTGFTAYVPLGSIARGAVIAASGVGTAPACESCHGAALQGVGNIPPLAGRSPTYIARELILFQTGKRTNPGAAPMRLEASKLTVRDMIAVAAYAASRKP